MYVLGGGGGGKSSSAFVQRWVEERQSNLSTFHTDDLKQLFCEQVVACN